MSLGAGIGLFVIGAILAFAVNVEVEWVDLNLIGYILMVAGVIGIILGIVLITRRRRSDTVSHTAVDPATGERVSRVTTDRDTPVI
jgi:membrane-bound ClpP family serine protease